jgi:hypothetical protein
MRFLQRISNGLLGAGFVAGALLAMSGCGPDYAIYKVNISSTDSSTLDSIAQCRITVTPSDSAKPVLDHYVLNGCTGLTNQNIGTFSYSSSRSSGSLKFKVEAYDANGYDPSDTTKNRLQWNDPDKSDPIPAKAYPPEITVSIAITGKH